MERRAKIMATLGPASWGAEVLPRLLEAGVDIVRLNLSHGTHEEHRATIGRVRRTAADAGRHVTVLLDLMGPRYRLGRFEGRPRLRKDTQVRLGVGEGVDVPVEEGFLEHLRPGERILIDNGMVELAIEEKRDDAVLAHVVTPGVISSRKGINLPDSDLPFAISEKDRQDIGFAVAEEVDYLAASYIGAPEHVEAVRREIRQAGGTIPVMAKLERAAAVEHLDGIVEAADAIMVARGDLGVEVPLHEVPVLQKRIIAAGRRSGKPVTVATQMLESMTEQPRPTRAEATDVANAVFDGADALMLSTETAAGKYPVEAVETMVRITEEAESYERQVERSRPGILTPLLPTVAGRPPASPLAAYAQDGLAIPDVVSGAAVWTTEHLDVRCVVAFSQGGFTARLIARYRPVSPIYVFTTDDTVARQIQLVWGARPLLMEAELEHHDEVVEVVERELLDRGLVEPGDAIVILMGDPIRERPLTNLMRVHRITADP